MKRLWIICLVLCLGSSAFTQDSSRPENHAYYLKILTNAKDSLYTSILKKYADYINQHPEDFKIQIEQCKLINSAYYDSYEDYNPNYEEAKSCSDALIEKFPDEPEVLLYGVEFLYGDSARTYLERLTKRIDADPDLWSEQQWKVYHALAENYRGGEEPRKIIRYGELAAKHNDTLDVTLLLGEAYRDVSNKEKAIEILISKLDSTNDNWILNQKGRVLLELGAHDDAIKAFSMAAKDTGGYQDDSGLAEAMIEKGLYEEARPYLVKEVEGNSWNRSAPLLKLLEFDLRHGQPDSAAVDYARLTNESFWNDPVGIYRIKLLMKNPWAKWTWADLGRFLLMVLLLVVVFLIPYLWILPIHYIGTYLKQRGHTLNESAFRWGLRHFWIACSLWLLVDLLSLLLFDYQGVVSMLTSSVSSIEIDPISKLTADMTLFFFSGCTLFTLFFLQRSQVAQFFKSFLTYRRAILTGIGLALLLKIGSAVYVSILQFSGIDFNGGLSAISSVKDNVLSINNFYHPLLGFFCVVIVVPIYEEILFRGVFLSACEKHMKFIFANILQSLVFATIHLEWKMFPFYFIFGMLAGHYQHKTKNLVVGTSMHMTNNLIAFMMIILLEALRSRINSF